ncbi:MAG: tetratricopeptide repeat protein [Bacteroidota bacterium]
MSRLLRRTLLLLCLLLCILPVPAQDDRPSSKQAIIEQHLLDLEFETAQERLPILSSMAEVAYYGFSVRIYQYLATQDKQYFQDMRSVWRHTENAIEELPESDRRRALLLAEIHCKRAAAEFIKGNYFSAVQYARSGRNYAIEQQQRFPKDQAIYKVLGVFNAMFGAVPSRYLWITEMLGYEGDVRQGLKQLTTAAQIEQSYLPIEAVLFASYIEKIMLNQSEQSLERLLRARKQHSPNAVLDYFCALAYMQNKQTEKALPFLQNQLASTNLGRTHMPYWDYQMGKAYYNRGNYQQAYPYFKRFLEKYRGKLFLTDAHFRLGMAYTLNGQYASGKPYFSRLAERENSGFDQDEYAAHLAQIFAERAPTTTERSLFQARHFYDGGYFEKAEQLLQNLNQQDGLSADNKTELYYRLGRLYHDQKQLSKAVEHYQAGIEQAAQEEVWLQAYARYYLGEIARQQNRPQEARKQYEAALKYDDYWYQSGLENRCKTRLGEIKGS